MYIRLIEAPTEKKEMLGHYSEDINIDTNDLLQVHRMVDEVWRRATQIDKDVATYCIYGDADIPLVKGGLQAHEGYLTSIEIIPVCKECETDLKTHGQFARRYGSTESEESRRRISYTCMNEDCVKYGVSLEMRAVLSA